MKDLLKNLKRRLADEETARYLRFTVIPLTVLILIIVIAVADKPKEDEGKEQTAASWHATDAAEETKEEPAKEASYRLEEAGDEIHGLMEAYFKARRTCDTDGMAQVYGDSASPEELKKEGLRMEEEVKYFQSYSDIACYTVSGPSEDSLVVYTRFTIKFRQSDTVAPSMFACLVKRGDDESWHMMAGITSEEESYMEEVNGSKAVQDMAEEVNVSLRAALEEDSNLLAVYNTLMNGEAAADGGEGAQSSEPDSE